MLTWKNCIVPACRAEALGGFEHCPPTFHFAAASFAFTAFKRRMVEPRRLELLTFSLRTRGSALISLVNIVVFSCVVSCRPHFNRRCLSNFGTPCHVVAINIKSKNLSATISHPKQICIKKRHQSHAPRVCHVDRTPIVPCRNRRAIPVGSPRGWPTKHHLPAGSRCPLKNLAPEVAPNLSAPVLRC